METTRLLLFTTLWTAIWAAPLPKLSRGVELIAGLIPFTAFTIGSIPRRWRLATLWVMPMVAIASLVIGWAAARYR